MDRSGQQHQKHDPRTEPTPDDGTPTNDPAAALHWAAVAHGLAETRTLQGNPLTNDERHTFDRYQNAAHAHGYTDQQIRAHVTQLNWGTAR